MWNHDLRNPLPSQLEISRTAAAEYALTHDAFGEESVLTTPAAAAPPPNRASRARQPLAGLRRATARRLIATAHRIDAT